MKHSTSYDLHTITNAVESLGGDSFASELLELIRSCADFDSAVIMAYPPESGELSVVHNALHAGDQPGFGGPYRDGLWMLSPLYLNAKGHRRGFFHILDLAPPDFQSSEYYELYYRSNGVVDHCGFLAETGQGTPVAVSLERTPALPPFSEMERAALDAIAPLVTALIRKQWPRSLQGASSAEPRVHQHIRDILENFGRDTLTPRERDVVQLVLQGHSSKSVAKVLSISTQTEQVHRKNIYAKLGLSSHNQLFSLFFDILVQP